MKRIEGKVAIVTGAGSGIGRASAILFAQEGAKVVVTCRTALNGEGTVRMIRKEGGEALYVKADVSQTKDVEMIVQKTIDSFGRLDILFNNAGVVGDYAPIMECTDQNFDRIISVNLRSIFLGMKYAIPEMVKVGRGSIINMSSTGAYLGVPNQAAYNASKGGTLSLTRTAAMEYVRKNIRVNCIAPGPILTPMTEGLNEETKMSTLEVAAPMGRWGKAEEIAQVALFLASNESSLVTGHCLVADGGWLVDSGFSSSSALG